jgi:hypothetical protein
MKQILLAFALFVTGVAGVAAQPGTNKKFWGTIEYTSGITLADRGKYYNNALLDGNGMMGIIDLRAIVGYYVHPNLSLGVGVGTNTQFGYNTDHRIQGFPLLFDVRYHAFSDKRLFLNGVVGGFSPSYELTDLGWFTDLLVGYQLNISKVRFAPAAGFNMSRYSIVEFNDAYNRTRFSVIVKLGILF